MCVYLYIIICIALRWVLWSRWRLVLASDAVIFVPRLDKISPFDL